LTQPQAASPAPVSDPAPNSQGLLPPIKNELICPSTQIFDAEKLRNQLSQAAKTMDATALRAEVVRLLREANKDGRAAIASAFALSPFSARALTQSYSHLTDGLVTSAFYAATELLHPLSNPTRGERIAVMAVGGYGRAEMAPFSDVDLLFLTPYKITAWAESVIESMLYILWDLRLKVGHSSRTIKDCIRLGAEDYTIRTAMLEHRFLSGDSDLAAELDDRLQSDLFS
jgi:[protein-PII] uridylyltransferase